jgi:peptidoglycan/LPS O-acetylase OafA/YrhL
MKKQFSSPQSVLGLALTGGLVLASLAVMIHGLWQGQWWGGFGIVLSMTAAILLVVAANPASDPLARPGDATLRFSHPLAAPGRRALAAPARAAEPRRA